VVVVLVTVVAIVPMVGIACDWILLLRNVSVAHYSVMMSAVVLRFALSDVVAVIIAHVVWVS
jgi:hypothetical protein